MTLAGQIRQEGSMDEYSIESKQEKIYHKKTKEYFSEVVTSYRDGSYRSSVVMLWSVAVCDLLFKVKHMVDMYSDTIAESILDEVKAMQSANERSSDWEIKLVELVKEKTAIIDISDFENLMHLQRQRHLSAHPVLTQGYELHRPNRETVRALIRNTLDGVLIKPPIYTRQIFQEFINDISASSAVLIDKEKLKKYLESKYLSRIDINVEMSLFRSLWKLVFRVQNEECEKNRAINYWALEIIYERSYEKILTDIESDKDYYANIANSGTPATFLIYFLSRKPVIHTALNDAAKMIIAHICENNSSSRCLCYFLKESIEQHCDDLIGWIVSDAYPTLQDSDISSLINMSDSPEWSLLSKKILNSYYATSVDYDDADTRFYKAIRDYIKDYDQEALTDFMVKAQNNSQTYDRRGAKYDHRLIKERCDEVLGEDFDYLEYRTFIRSTE
jgi:hypothetical protein|tara:strand:- start:1753 stop:3090 length:1338 start_codon:yes stop_codon:yes gene_type:complete